MHRASSGRHRVTRRVFPLLFSGLKVGKGRRQWHRLSVYILVALNLYIPTISLCIGRCGVRGCFVHIWLSGVLNFGGMSLGGVDIISHGSILTTSSNSPAYLLNVFIVATSVFRWEKSNVLRCSWGRREFPTTLSRVGLSGTSKNVSYPLN
jgi:hypothetical protein